MSNWPNATDYRDALQHPARAFRDPVLRACRAETNRMDVPRTWSGAFANVYRLMDSSSARAVRLFLYPQPEREQRYQAIASHLDRCRRPRAIVGFRYEPQGVCVNGEWFPVQVMDWITGETFDNWVGAVMRSGDRRRLLGMAEQWVRLLDELREARIAHGDLQHANILVVNDTPFLVDYDCMCVPALVGHEAPEFGKPAYQHPRRLEQPLSLDLDHFSAWIILIALRALAADPTLWARHVESTGNENLLFTETDLRDPNRSRLWPELLTSPDAEVRDWARGLRDTLPDKPHAHVPPFDLDALRALRNACEAKPRDWDRIRALASRPQLTGQTLPAEVTRIRDEAMRRTAARDRLQLAVSTGSARQTAAAYDPKLLDDWPACAELAARGRAALEQVKALDELDTARRAQDNGRQLVSLWGRYSSRLTGVAEASPLRTEAERWRARIEACDRFKTVSAQPSASERAIADAWARLAAAGGHPDAAAGAPRAELARKRADLLDALRQAASAESENGDRRLDALWEETLLKGCVEAEALRARVQLGRDRLRIVKELEEVLALADCGKADEARVAAVAGRLPAGYKHHLAARVAQLRSRLALSEQFLRLVGQPGASERAIADAWNRLEASGNASPAAAAHRRRAEIARVRADLLDRLRGVPTTASEDGDRQLDKLWDESLLADCAEAAGVRPRLAAARARLKVLETLRRVIERADRGEAREKDVVKAAEGLPAGYAHALAARVQRALQQVGVKEDLERLIAAEPPSDIAIADSFQRAAATGSLRLEKSIIQRCRLAVQRRDCLKRVRSIDSSLPLDEQDALWEEQWDEPLLEPCHDARQDRPRHRLAVQRLGAWRTLEQALDRRDQAQVRAALANPLLKDYPPCLRRAKEIDALLGVSEQPEQARRLLRECRKRGFTEADLEFIRANEALFRPCQDELEEVLGTWLDKDLRLRPSSAQWLADPRSGVVTVRWVWPHDTVRYCYVVTDPDQFYESPGEAPHGYSKVLAENHRRAGGLPLPALPRWRRGFVTVWAVIDLHWTQLLGQPLRLGPVPLLAARGERG
jgi:hypothetical protein